MTRERFVKLVEEALGKLPAGFRRRIENLAIVVEDLPPGRTSRPGLRTANAAPEVNENLLLGVFQGVPATKKSVWNASAGPNRIVLYQRNIEAICSTEEEIREQVRLTVLHELGHYFGMTEDQLRDV